LKNILIVSANEKSRDTICNLLKCYNDIKILTTSSASKARRYSSNNEVSIAIINTPLKEEFGTELGLDLADINIGTIIIAKSDIAQQISADVELAGILVLAKPIIKSLFHQYIKIQMSVNNRIINLKKENDKLKNKISEIKIIDRAKLTLMEYEMLSENEAHKKIEKTAMDRRLSRIEIAKEILHSYNTY